MKRIFPILLLLFCGILSFAAEQSDQYCYIFDRKCYEKQGNGAHSVEAHDWFLSEKLYNPEKTGYVTVDGKQFFAKEDFHLMTEEEYEKILKGKKVVNNQGELSKWFKSNIPANKLVWEKEKARIAKREADIARYSKMIPFKINNWTMLLLLLPFMIPILLMFINAVKYDNQRYAGAEPSVVRPWAAVVLVLAEAAIGYYYGRFLYLAFQGIEGDVNVSKALFIIVAAVLAIGLLYSTVSVKKNMLATYNVKFGAGNIIITILVAMASLFAVAILLLIVDDLFHVPDSLEPYGTAIIIGLSLIAPIVYIQRTIHKQNSDAFGLLIPMLVLAVFGAVVLVLGGILFVAAAGSSGSSSSSTSSSRGGSNDNHESAANTCSNCYWYGWDCSNPKSYGVCQRFVKK